LAHAPATNAGGQAQTIRSAQGWQLPSADLQSYTPWQLLTLNCTDVSGLELNF